ncbi:hypothetical protein BC828DRAFT_391090 [Blastocladiella britannica]|nr:hypothetical protein BC828DRAFT_391090 [Blastocladiella britannica]
MSSAAVCPHHYHNHAAALTTALRPFRPFMVPTMVAVAAAGAVGLVYLRNLLRDPNPLAIWTSLSGWPPVLRTLWFTKLVHLANPFSATGGVRIVSYGPGACVASMTERRALRNPFGSIHAAALALAGETAAGMAFLGTLPKSMRAIPTGMRCEYIKKARGTICAVVGPGSFPEVYTSGTVDVVAEIRSGSTGAGELLARVIVAFEVRPKASHA